MKSRSSWWRGFVSNSDVYLENNGQRISKPVFYDIHVYTTHGMTFVSFSWDENNDHKNIVLTKEQVLVLKPNFGIPEVKDAGKGLTIDHFENFTIMHHRHNGKLSIYNNHAEEVRTIKTHWITLTDAGVGYKDEDHVHHMIVLNGEKIEEFSMKAGSPGFTEPHNFMWVQRQGWDNESLSSEVKYIKALVKNDLRNWGKRTKKYVAYFSDIHYELKVFDEAHSIVNTREVLKLVKARVDDVKAYIEANESNNNNSSSNEIGDYCEKIDNDTFGI